MLYIQFSVDNERYLIAADQVEMLMPVVTIRKVEQSTALFPGCIQVKGDWLPVVDLVQLFANRPARMRLSTRIIITNLQGLGSPSTKAAFLVEKVAELIRLEDSSFVNFDQDKKNNPALDAQAQDDMGTLQRLQMDYFAGSMPTLNVCDELIRSLE